MIKIEIDTIDPRREQEIAEVILSLLGLLPEQHAVEIQN